ncbi:PP2C family serine/threonine-protein phosphatase [Nocardia farcinica]|uniref:PP2C family serine/threonine-protein phosphatase n=1 Tax=Nocardia farcinica TaxID=37329 RepID=UPI002453872E|nr:PP2C family serine/threonine-protein phosphatase [Nocardia farcinica]
MQVRTAALPAATDEDRALIYANGVVVLDGATSHDPAVPPASEYVNVLGVELSARLGTSTDPVNALSEAIGATTAELDLEPGASPSSTVAMVHVEGETVTVALLGDSTVVVGIADGTYTVETDDRLNQLHIPEAAEYRNRLAGGSGYDQTHRDLLRELQRQQRERRNISGGYWIAEAVPDAARHAPVLRYDRDRIDWLILATDGARDTLEALGVHGPRSPHCPPTACETCSNAAAPGKPTTIPTAGRWPRSKRHDDKTLAVVHL